MMLKMTIMMREQNVFEKFVLMMRMDRRTFCTLGYQMMMLMRKVLSKNSFEFEDVDDGDAQYEQC